MSFSGTEITLEMWEMSHIFSLSIPTFVQHSNEFEMCSKFILALLFHSTLKKAINLNFTTSMQNHNVVCSSLWSCQEVWIKWLLSVWLHETKVGFRSSNKNNSCWLCMLKHEEVSEKGDVFPRLHRSSSYSGSIVVSHTADVHLLTAYRAVRSALLRMPSHLQTVSFFVVNNSVVEQRTCTFHNHISSTQRAPAAFPSGLSLRQTSPSGTWNRNESRTRHIK